ncbi:MAG: hypothetical protein HKN04_12705, partial [Rhodothermaceae bacterium]|nr:hypothetical protein [Rhodothermaceae bacterium]
PLLLPGCADGPTMDERVDRVSHEAVERYRTAVLLRTQGLDARIAAIETEAATADSARAVALQPTIRALHAQRQAIQRGLDSLDNQPEAVFAEARQAIDTQLDALAAQLGAAPDSLDQGARAGTN